MDWRDTSLEVDVPDLGLADFGLHSAFRDGTRVYVSLPGGKRVGFTFVPFVQRLFGLEIFRPNFIADPGTTVQLSVPDVELKRVNGEYFSLSGGIPFNPASSFFGGSYTFRSKSGFRYLINGNTGFLTSVTDRNGNRLDFSENGILSPTGRGVQFERDRNGRITALTDPLGNRTTYEYDSEGNLVKVTDPELNETIFEYGR